MTKVYWPHCCPFSLFSVGHGRRIKCPAKTDFKPEDENRWICPLAIEKECAIKIIAEGLKK